MTNPTLYSLASQPLSWFDLMRASMRLFFSSFLRALPYAIVPVVLLIALSGGCYAVADEDETSRTWILYLFAAILWLSPALFAPLIYRVHALAHGRPASAKEALRRGVRCLLPCLLGAALYMVAVGIGSILLVLPGVYVAVALVFWWVGVVADGLPLRKACSLSLRLVRGKWWHTFLGFMYIYAVGGCVNAFDVRQLSMQNEIAEAVLASLAAVLVTAIFPVFVSANMVVVYHDLSLRRADEPDVRKGA